MKKTAKLIFVKTNLYVLNLIQKNLKNINICICSCICLNFELSAKILLEHVYKIEKSIKFTINLYQLVDNVQNNFILLKIVKVQNVKQELKKFSHKKNCQKASFKSLDQNLGQKHTRTYMDLPIFVPKDSICPENIRLSNSEYSGKNINIYKNFTTKMNIT